ncbi:RNA polymerase sigma factor [Rhizobium sp. AAP43]|uniref:RNA polymerase sigma factor n=1 Tax=Rhizobium sp. AAP43 TaxID=1523420 RepID=UPI0006BA073F|nr:RNA polymerase sigma factor [Rhizobium sp. AAP43]KPF41149.1 RNA polymerase subunit sigma-24 [Rhizobium sp. AAP43]
MADPVHQQIEGIYRQSAPRIRATLIRLLGSFELADEALHDAFLQASMVWPSKGVPRNPEPWLVSAGRFRTIDRLRKRALADRHQDDLAYLAEIEGRAEDDPMMIEDDMLRLIFTCCHPALPDEGRMAMALREVCGLTTEEIARAFLTLPATIAQRIVRAKAKIRAQRIPYAIPEMQDLPERIETVLTVVYLLFNEGHGRAGPSERLSDDAIHLGRLIAGMIADTECLGLLALMLFQQSRKSARLDKGGALVLLTDQNRDLWDAGMIAEGETLLSRIHATGEIGAYGLQASIAACHARARSAEDTDWHRILALYDMLLEASPSPVVALNRAVALAEVDGESTALAVVDRLLQDPAMKRYHAAYSVKADLERRLGHVKDARASYVTALALAGHAHERGFIEARLKELA